MRRRATSHHGLHFCYIPTPGLYQTVVFELIVPALAFIGLLSHLCTHFWPLSDSRI